MDGILCQLDSMYITTETVVVDRDLNDSKFRMTMKKIGKVVSDFIGTIIKMATTLISKIKGLYHEANKQIDAARSSVSVIDKYNYVAAATRASEIIDEYFGLLTKLRALDHEINKNTSALDSIKQGMKENAIGRGKNKESKRDMLEEVIFYLGKADECKEALDDLIQKTSRDIPINNPRRYSLDFIKKEINVTFTAKIKMLEDLKKQLEITKSMYDDRNFVYRKMHSEDIRRNQTILAHAGSLIRQTEEFRHLYIKLLSQVDGVNISDENDN